MSDIVRFYLTLYVAARDFRAASCVATPALNDTGAAYCGPFKEQWTWLEEAAQRGMREAGQELLLLTGRDVPELLLEFEDQL